VWRGERPQEGRCREFTQCDIDVINPDQVPVQYDAELPRVIGEILTELKLPAWSINVNNRKVLQGFYEGLGISDPIAVIRVADRIDKVGPQGVRELLVERVGLDQRQADACLALAEIRGTDATVIDRVTALGVRSELLTTGLDELAFVLSELGDRPSGSIVADLSIARGLDYYTGTVYEGKFRDWPTYGSICSGGRYENLAGAFTRRQLPGIGMSIGLTRILGKLIAEGRLEAGPKCPTDVLVVIPSDERRGDAAATGAQLRGNGANVEVYHQPDKLAKQLRYASRKGIPFVWFPPFEDGRPHEVKDMIAGQQDVVDPGTWRVPARR